MVRRISRLLQPAIALGFATCLTLSPAAQAIPLGDIAASASITFDEGFAAGGIGGSGTQAGSLRLSNQADTTYSGAAAGVANPLTGAFTNTGQGFGFNGIASAGGAVAGTFGVFIDYGFHLFNASATNAYRITLGLRYDNQVASSGGDAFAHSEFVLRNGSTELFFTDLWSDVASGNVVGGNPTGDFGGALSDGGSRSFAFDLAAGGTLDLDGFWDLRGGTFDQGSAADSFFDVFFTIDDVVRLGQPPTPVPVPGTLALLLLGLAILSASISRRGMAATTRRFA